MKRRKFSLSHYKLFSCDMGELVPVGCVEVLPGDTIQGATSALVRASPMLAPVMHPVHVRYHWWYVPHRLVWTDFENFITGGPDGLNASVFPTITFGGGGAVVGSLADYMGVPTLVNNLAVSALPFRAYALIWNEWYRDQDLETALTISKASGADSTTNVALQNCDWEKDYFTTARPWEQKGPAVTIPLVGNAPVSGIGIADGFATGATGAAGRQTPPLADLAAGTQTVTTVGNLQVKTSGTTPTGVNNRLQIFADLSQVSGVSINSLRQALAIQRFEEARARYGSRYVEYLRYLGVRSSDARLQRPEYLGGGKQTLSFSEVLQTAPGADPVGALKGHGIAAMRSRRFRRFFEEHGYMICLMTVKPKTMYYQGLPRSYNRRFKEDFWQKELEHLGQQAVLNKEIYAAHASPDGTFGYQDRYDEYRRMESTVAGEFRTNTLNFWHFGRDFGSSPALNATFVKCVPTERTFASSSTDVLYVMAMHSIQARRMIARGGQSFTR